MEYKTLSELLPSPSLPLFIVFFMVIYLTGLFLVFRKWSPDIRSEASSCLISFFHGTPAVFFSSLALLSDSTQTFSSQNFLTHNIALDYSIAYFLMDLTHYLIFFPSEVLFIAHHLATLYVLLTCRFVVARGACGILLLLILAEVTSFCQNAWTLSGTRKEDIKLASSFHHGISPLFYSIYTVIRGVIGPWSLWRMGWHFYRYREEDAVPAWAWVSWLIVVAAAIAASIMWITNLWIALFNRKKVQMTHDKLN